jgi:hypothetical protein
MAILAASAASAQKSDLFVIEGRAGPVTQTGGDHNVVDLLQGFIELDRSRGWGLLVGFFGFTGSLSYIGVPDALLIDVTDNATKLTLAIPSTGKVQVFSGANLDDLSAQVESWFKSVGAEDWADFLRAMNGLSPLALLSGNPKSTVALMGDSAYRKFGFDDSRSRMGFNQTIKRWGGFELRVDAAVSTVNTATFTDDLWTFDPSITLAGDFGRHVGLSFSLVGQYRSYDGARLADLGAELALPITLRRPDQGPYFWQITPFFQAAGGVSVDFAAGGLLLGGGLVNALGWNHGPFEVLMSNEIAYYGGLPIDDIGGYDFATELSQLYFKNGLEGTWWIGKGFYADAGVHFTNFALDAAAVSWFATPTVGLGWEAGRWIDLRLAYEADLSTDDYRAHNLQLKLDFLF